MTSLKSQVGQSSGPYRDEITKSRIARFCHAVGIEESKVAPPTFLTVFRKGEFDLFQKLGIQLSRVLHCEQVYQYDRSIHAGDIVHFQTMVSQILEKQSSATSLQFVTFETTFQIEGKSQLYSIGKSRTTIVVRENVRG